MPAPSSKKVAGASFAVFTRSAKKTCLTLKISFSMETVFLPSEKTRKPRLSVFSRVKTANAGVKTPKQSFKKKTHFLFFEKFLP